MIIASVNSRAIIIRYRIILNIQNILSKKYNHYTYYNI